MPATAARYAHIAYNEQGIAVIRGTRIKIPLLIASHIANRWDAEQLQVQYPDLTLGQIHGALAYYYDHKRQVDREIKRRMKRADELLKKLANPKLQARLRAAKAKLRE